MNSYPHCVHHKYSPMQFVEVTSENCNWICSSCLVKSFQQQKQKSTIILDLLELKSDPFQLKNIFPENFSIFSEFYQTLDNLEKSQSNLLDQLKSLIEMANIMVTKIESQINKSALLAQEVKNEELKILNIEKFQELNNVLWNSQTELNQDTKQQFELRLFSYIKSLMRPINIKNELSKLYLGYAEIFLQNILFDHLNKLDDFVKTIKLEVEKKQNTLKFSNNLSLLGAKVWVKQQIEIAENKKIKQEQLLYEGEKNQPYSTELIKKILGKKNILMIFKSKNKGGTIFGAYSPYEWKQSQYIGDQVNNTSFLFQFNSQKIYPIKKECTRCTQYIDQQFLLFGGSANWDQDFLLYFDLNKKGYSQLGKASQAPGIDLSKKSDVLFGDLEPNIEECQVFELSLI